MPNVSIQSETKSSSNGDHSEVDELETDVSSMEPTSPLPAPSSLTTSTATNITNNTNTNTIITNTKKPEPGSAEWYNIRKENHKKVERRRRETINRAMEDLVAVIPGNEKNKSKILRRAVQHIKHLVEEIMTLRQQVDEYRETHQQQKVEITELRALLDMQQRQQQQQQQQSTNQPIKIHGSS